MKIQFEDSYAVLDKRTFYIFPCIVYTDHLLWDVPNKFSLEIVWLWFNIGVVFLKDKNW